VLAEAFPVLQRKALVTLFQHWFSAAAEEGSESRSVAACLKEVKKATPSLLAFLVNLADDNGNTALHYSCLHNKSDCVKLLLRVRANMHISNIQTFHCILLPHRTSLIRKFHFY